MSNLRPRSAALTSAQLNHALNNQSESFEGPSQDLTMNQNLLNQSSMSNPLNMRNLRSQLSYMVNENDSLRFEVKSLNRSLQRTLSTSNTSNLVEGLTREIMELRNEITSVKEERDNA